MSSKKRSRRPPPRKSTTPRQRPTVNAGATRVPQTGRPFYTPGSSAFRQSVEKASAPLLLMLTQGPRWVMMFTPLILILLGFFLPLAIGLVFLGIFFVFTGWLAYLSWPRADGRAKLIRIAMFALVIALVAIRVSRA